MRNLFRASLAVFTVLGLVAMFAWADDPKSIKEIMKKAHDEKEGLLGKVKSGKSTKQEREELLNLYKDLAANKPSKGSEKEWKKKTDAIVTAAEAVAAAEDKDVKKALPKLVTATNCSGCHVTFKGK